LTTTKTRGRRDACGDRREQGDTLTYSVVANPSHGTLSGTAPSLTYYTDRELPTAPTGFTFKANDRTDDSRRGHR